MAVCSRCGKTMSISEQGDNTDKYVVFHEALRGVNAWDEAYCNTCVAEMKVITMAVSPRPILVQDILQTIGVSAWHVLDKNGAEMMNNTDAIADNMSIKTLLDILHREVTSVEAHNNHLNIYSKATR